MKIRSDYGTPEELEQEANLALVNLPEVLAQIRQAMLALAEQIKLATTPFIRVDPGDGYAPEDDTDPALGRNTTTLPPQSTWKGEKDEK